MDEEALDNSDTRLTHAPSDEEVVTVRQRKRRRVRRVAPVDETPNFDIPGVRKIVLSEETQKLLGCYVGEHITAENPWKRIAKEALEYDIESREDTSEFVPFKANILKYTREEILIGYIPDETRDCDEFYVCLTAQAEASVVETIKRLKEIQEERLQNSIYKKIKRWVGYGCEEDIEKAQLKQKRQLIQVELESEYPIQAGCLHKFRINLAKNSLESYVELLPLRLTFTNVSKKRLTVGTQVTPETKPRDCQTRFNYPKQNSTQYEYECKHVREIPKELQDNFRAFVETEMEGLDDQLILNSNIDFYRDDYASIVLDPATTLPRDRMPIKEYISISDLRLPRGLAVSCIVWHPLLSATVAVAYSSQPLFCYNTGKQNADRVNRATFDVPPVRLWSFVDSLCPSLLLGTPSEVTCLEFCPYNENLLVGGCSSGQVVIWDLTNKLQKAEEQELLSGDQQRYRNIMQSLMNWMKNTRDLRFVQETAISNLRHSHSSPVTSIMWLCPFREITKCGRITAAPEQENRVGKQFVSCSLDGNILVWDLNWQPTYIPGGIKPPRRSRRIKQRPPALAADVSPFRVLNRILRPIFLGYTVFPGTSRKIPLTAITYQRIPEQYEERNPDPHKKYSFFNRIEFKANLTIPTEPIKTEFFAGSAEGDYISATFDGFDVSSGGEITKELCKMKCFSRYHDGPICTIARADKFQDLILTVGGKVFAIWHIDYTDKPVLWRRSRSKYTHGGWYLLCASKIRLTRMDGIYEIWDLGIVSTAPMASRGYSVCPVTCSVTHKRFLKQNYFALGDTHGDVRIFLLSKTVSTLPEKEQRATYELCLRERLRKVGYQKWLKEWRRTHRELLEERAEAERLKLEYYEEAIKKRKADYAEQKEIKVSEEDCLGQPEPGKYEEWAHKKWTIKENDRMNKLLLKNKALDMDVLKSQLQPIVKLQKQEQSRGRKYQQYLERASGAYEEAKHTILADSLESTHVTESSDPYACGDTFSTSADTYVNYKQVAGQSEEYIEGHSYHYKFDWAQVLRAGKHRRRVLDGYNTRYTHDERIKREKKAPTTVPAPTKVLARKSSSGSSVASGGSAPDNVDELGG